jgi:hypothetical protein
VGGIRRGLDVMELRRAMNAEWRSEALSRFPELRERADGLDTPYMVWIELQTLFERAYQEPRNEDLIERIYDYSAWCVDQPGGKTATDDLGTCVCVCFYEHIPTCEEAVKDMPRWWSREDVVGMERIFSYLVGDEGYARVLAQFPPDGAEAS